MSPRAASGAELGHVEIDTFNGLDTLTAPDSVPSGYSPFCSNVEFEGKGKKAGSRSGTSTSFDLTAGTDVLKAAVVDMLGAKYYLFLMDDHKLYYSVGNTGETTGTTARVLLVDTSSGSPTSFKTILFGNLVFIFMHDGNGGINGPWVWDTAQLNRGTVTTNGTAVTWVAGGDFSAGTVNELMIINGVVYTLQATPTSPWHSITLTGSAGVQAVAVAYGFIQVDLCTIPSPTSIGALAATPGSAGVTTPGIHKISVVFETRSGYRAIARDANNQPVSLTYTAPDGVSATDQLTASGTPSNNDNFTVGGTTYTFVTALSGAANEVLIDGQSNSILNAALAIMGQPTEGVNYGVGTTPNNLVNGIAVGSVLIVSARAPGASGNAIAVSKSGANLSWASTTLTGGSSPQQISLTGIPVFTAGAGHVTAEVVKRYIVMTAAGLSTFFLVGKNNGGEIDDNTTTTATINISDAQLQAQTDVSGYYSFLAPLPIAAMGFLFDNRMIMIGVTANFALAYVSEVGFPQNVRADTGFLQPNGAQSFRITNIVNIRLTLYLILSLGIVAYTDDGNPPSLWPQNTIASDVGTISYDGVSNESDDGECVIDDFKGLYRFDGSAPVRITRLMDPTWATRNIGVGNTARTYIDTLNHRVLSFIATGNATRPNTVFVVDYGDGWKSPKFTTWTTAGTAWRDFIIDQPNILIATAGSTVRLLDPAAITDNGTAITWTYRFEPMWAHGSQSLTYFDGMYLRATGGGTLDLRVYDTEGTLLATPTPWTLTAKPIADFYRGFNFTEERLFFEIGQSAANGFCQFSWAQFDLAPDGERSH